MTMTPHLTRVVYTDDATGRHYTNVIPATHTPPTTITRQGVTMTLKAAVSTEDVPVAPAVPIPT